MLSAVFSINCKEWKACHSVLSLRQRFTSGFDKETAKLVAGHVAYVLDTSLTLNNKTKRLKHKVSTTDAETERWHTVGFSAGKLPPLVLTSP